MEAKKITLSKDTLVPLGLVLVLCSGAVWLNSRFTSIDYSIESLNHKLEDQWTHRDMENLLLKIKLNNPEMVISEDMLD